MEVGAVKQAFNNEAIHLKKKLNQAKIQIIHKLTRKAKTLTQKKVPEALQAKSRRKAETAVKEVLEIKKVTAKELAKFAVSHKGKLSDYLNKPTIDKDRACARMLLHKVLEDKYSFLRETFTDIAIDDLLLSRDERRKLKKEQIEKKQNKRKISLTEHSESGDWSIEDVDLDISGNENNKTENTMDSDISGDENVEKIASDFDNDDISEKEFNNYEISQEHIDKNLINLKVNSIENKSNKSLIKTKEVHESNDTEKESSDENELNESDSVNDNECTDNEEQPELKKTTENHKNIVSKNLNTKSNTNSIKKQKQTLKNNKKLKEKIMKKKLGKEEVQLNQDNKTADPFFITSSGENYMSLVEPRLPDEVKEVHKEGNRRSRRAVLFGHALKRPRNESRFNNQNNFNENKSKFNKQGPNWNNRNSYNEDNQVKFNGKKDFSNENNRRKDSLLDGTKDSKSVVPEKLHPSWEAKKKQSGLLPFAGKKTVFE